MADYPTSRSKEAFFAIKFQTHALRRGVCNDFGTEGFALLSLVVTTEDRLRYGKAPRFWWDNLTDVLGIRRQKLSVVLKALSEAGWLHYTPGGKGVMSTLWVTTPNGDSSIDSAPLGGDCSVDSVTTNEPETELQTDQKRHRKRTESVTRTEPEASLILIPSPISLPPSPEDGAQPVADTDLTTCGVRHAFVLSEWNIVGPIKAKFLNATRNKLLKARLKDAWWRENWRDGLARVPDSGFLFGRDGGWKADFDWFVQPDSLLKILEGKYENHGAESPRINSTHSREEQRQRNNLNAIANVMQSAGLREGAGLPNSSQANP